MILILAVGQKQPAWVNDAVADYLNRISADARPMLKEIKAEPRNAGKSIAVMMAAEAARIEAAIPSHTTRIVLDERGKPLTTHELGDLIKKAQQQCAKIAFLIGGPDGLDPNLKSACDDQLRLSSMTLPHGLVRVLLAEQLYRVWSVTKNHPYHRS